MSEPNRLVSYAMGRVSRPAEIPPAALYLVSGASSYVTDNVVVINGGYTA